MSRSDSQYTKLQWFFTIFSLTLYVSDIITDTRLAFRYFQEGHFLWMGLTLLFILVGLLVTQAFSYAWSMDDLNDSVFIPEGNPDTSKCELAVLHLFGMGIYIRFCRLLKLGFEVLFTKTTTLTVEELKDMHRKLFRQAADLSMLKLFESFLESAPQLLLQLYILTGHQEISIAQYFSIAFSFLNIAWALVDYQRCLRRVLPDVSEMKCGVPTAVYLLYKLGTITSHILSYCLFLILSTYSAVALTVIWLLGTAWAYWLQTNFCSSRGLEFLYRAVIGVILMFSFFNVKGQETKEAMFVYYFFYSLVNVTGPILLTTLKPDLLTPTVFLLLSWIIVSGLVLGLVCLVLYYLLLHPRDIQRQADEVDGQGQNTETTSRIMKFLQP